MKGLNAVKAFSRASGAAAVDVSNYLSDTVPRLIVAFSKERFGRNIGVTAVLKNIENTAVGEPLSDERRTNVERRLLDLITKDEEDNENGNAIIAAFLERKKFCRFRATLSMACRTYTSDVCGLNKDTMLDNLCRHQKIEGFLKLLEESGMTVAQMFDYAIAGAEKYFGLYVHEKLRSQTMAALKECAEDKAVDVLRAAAGSADSKVLCEYIQHSNSKVNLEINRKIPGTTH
ncbi:MAG: hypothetical protein E7554_01450 [Ruminococcaceae bacterium]|nr:hypothetical protein [Oscillospiraceae bacterium]